MRAGKEGESFVSSAKTKEMILMPGRAVKVDKKRPFTPDTDMMLTIMHKEQSKGASSIRDIASILNRDDGAIKERLSHLYKTKGIDKIDLRLKDFEGAYHIRMKRRGLL